MTTYARSLSSITGGQGSYTIEFSHYDIVPGNVQQEIIAKASLAEEEEDGPGTEEGGRAGSDGLWRSCRAVVQWHFCQLCPILLSFPFDLPRRKTMTAAILDGKALATEIRAEIAQEVAAFTQETGVTPCLAAVLVGENPASQVYVRNKQKACEKAGIDEPAPPPAGRDHDRTNCWP